MNPQVRGNPFLISNKMTIPDKAEASTIRSEIETCNKMLESSGIWTKERRAEVQVILLSSIKKLDELISK